MKMKETENSSAEKTIDWIQSVNRNRESRKT